MGCFNSLTVQRMTLTPRANYFAFSSLWSRRRQKDAAPDRNDTGGAPGHGDSDSVRAAAGSERGVHAQQRNRHGPIGSDPRAASARPRANGGIVATTHRDD